MRRNWITGVAAAVLAFGLVCVPAYAQGGTALLTQGGSSPKSGQKPGADWGRRGGVGRVAGRLGVLRTLTDPDVRDRLGLSAAQRESLDALLFESAKRAVRLQSDLKSLRLEMLEQMRTDQPERAALEAKIDEIGAVRSNLARMRLDAFFQIRELLTPEQRDLLRENLRKGRRGARRQAGRKSR